MRRGTPRISILRRVYSSADDAALPVSVGQVWGSVIASWHTGGHYRQQELKGCPRGLRVIVPRDFSYRVAFGGTAAVGVVQGGRERERAVGGGVCVWTT